MMRERRDVSAGVIVFQRTADGCRFLLLRSRLTRRPLWEFPKGGLNAGETLQQAALRELEEETGLARRDVRLVAGFEHAEDYRFVAGDDSERTFIRKRVTYYLAEAKRTEVTLSEESSRFAWLSLADAQRKLRYKSRRVLLENAAEAASCAAAQRETSSRSREARRPPGRRRA